MRWCTRRRSRTICLSLAFATVFFHLLLALVVLSIYNQPCDTHSSPKIHSLRMLANANYMSTWASSLVKPPLDTNQMDSSKSDAKLNPKMLAKTANKAGFEDLSGRERPASFIIDDKDSLMKKSENALLTIAAKLGRYHPSLAEPTGSGLSKLEALFRHPMYNMPSLTIPEEDWLLKVKPKVKASERSSQMW